MKSVGVLLEVVSEMFTASDVKNTVLEEFEYRGGGYEESV